MCRKFDEAVFIFLSAINDLVGAEGSQELQDVLEQELLNMKIILAKSKAFVPPTPEEIEKEAEGLGYDADGDKFCEFYGSKGWMVGKSKMKSWVMALNRACKDGWCLRSGKKEPQREDPEETLK